jgi:hypothetical protein
MVGQIAGFGQSFACVNRRNIGIVSAEDRDRALSGTSELASAERRESAFGVSYTGTIGAGALSPGLYGLTGDATSLSMAMLLVAAGGFIDAPAGLAAASRSDALNGYFCCSALGQKLGSHPVIALR